MNYDYNDDDSDDDDYADSKMTSMILLMMSFIFIGRNVEERTAVSGNAADVVR